MQTKLEQTIQTKLKDQKEQISILYQQFYSWRSEATQAQEETDKSIAEMIQQNEEHITETKELNDTMQTVVNQLASVSHVMADLAQKLTSVDDKKGEKAKKRKETRQKNLRETFDA